MLFSWFLNLIIMLLIALTALFVLIQPVTSAIGVVENIKGVPFPQDNSSIIITEKLAHADVFLDRPVIGQKLRLKFQYAPRQMKTLAVGVRENSFWLSYHPIEFYNRNTNINQPGDVARDVELTFPLTDKITDREGSVDVMFFADYEGSTKAEYEGENDKTSWLLSDLQVQVDRYRPDWLETKDFVRAWVSREKPL